MTQNILVTGGSGFLGLHIVRQLLAEGANVRTTVRTAEAEATVRATLEAVGVATDRLTFVYADLGSDANWAAAMAEQDVVMSVASPVFFGKVTDEAAAITPAVAGIRRILTAATAAHVQRVVMTSNFGAVGFSKRRGAGMTTEADWTNPDEPGLSIYEKSKLIAEQQAWAFVAATPGAPELTAINPVAMLGQSLNAHTSGSFHILTNLLAGHRMPTLPLNIVDVRDVAAMHILAARTPAAAGERFIATADGQINLPEIAALLRKERPAVAGKIVPPIPNWVLQVAAPFNQQARGGNLFNQMNRAVSNEKARNILGWRPRETNADLILATVDGLIANGQLPLT